MFSTDMGAMYPPLDIDEVAKVAAIEFLNSSLEVDLDWMELSLYLALVMDRKDLVKMATKKSYTMLI